MALFTTHITVGCGLSGIAATSLLAANLATPEEVILYLGLGTLGSILPDLDSNKSTSLRLTFNLSAIFFAFFTVFSLGKNSTAAEMVILGFVSFALVKYGILAFFTKLTVHRGIIHSIPASILFGFLCILLLYKMFNYSALTAWWGGIFVFYGCMVHLLLDEMYSINLRKVTIRKSFGSAMKLGSSKNIPATFLIYLLLFLTYRLLPEPNDLLTLLRNFDFANCHFFPEDKWFEDILGALVYISQQQLPSLQP